jgi:hypothetical protein
MYQGNVIVQEFRVGYFDYVELTLTLFDLRFNAMTCRSCSSIFTIRWVKQKNILTKKKK